MEFKRYTHFRGASTRTKVCVITNTSDFPKHPDVWIHITEYIQPLLTSMVNAGTLIVVQLIRHSNILAYCG